MLEVNFTGAMLARLLVGPARLKRRANLAFLASPETSHVNRRCRFRLRLRINDEYIARLVPLAELLQSAAIQRDFVSFLPVIACGSRHHDTVVGDSFISDHCNFLAYFIHMFLPRID